MLKIYNEVKSFIRDLIPTQYQVPLKYYYNQVSSDLEPEMILLQHLVKNNDLVIDVGGNRGIYAYKLWKLGCKVEVFEPNPICLSVLQAWAVNKRGVNIHSVGLSNSVGSANLHIPIDDNGVEHDASASMESTEFECSRDQLVPIQTLDNYHFEDVRFIKIDVEGHEYNVIQGAAKLLQSSRPVLLIEIEQRHHGRPIDEVFESILDFGYQGFFMGMDGLTVLAKFDLSQCQSLENFGSSKEKYINNFLFLDRNRLEDGEYDELFSGKGWT